MAIGGFFSGYATRLRGVSLYHASENSWVWVPYNWAGDGTKRGVIYCHGAGSTVGGGTDPAAEPGQFAYISAAAAAGYPVFMADFGGNAWGNAALRALIADAKTYLQGTVGAKSGTVLMMGTSMGGLNCLSYAGNNLSSVAALAVVGPVSDVQDIVTNDRGGLASSVNAAYSGGYSNATYGATCNPTVMAANGNYGSLPCKFWYGNSDAICVPSTITGLAASIGASASAVQITGGHAESTWANVPPADVVAFLDAHQ